MADVRTVTASRQVPGRGTVTSPVRRPRPVDSSVIGMEPILCEVRVNEAGVGHLERGAAHCGVDGRSASGTDALKLGGAAVVVAGSGSRVGDVRIVSTGVVQNVGGEFTRCAGIGRIDRGGCGGDRVPGEVSAGEVEE